MARSRWSLYIQARILRPVIAFAMLLNRLGFPRPLSPRLTRTIPVTVSPIPGSIKLLFFTPPEYGKAGNQKRYPVLLTFFNSGFCVGGPRDDARWATAVVQQADTVVCSVGYRLAPECPFPTAVEDGADAVLWLLDHADELGIDKERIGLSGFSSGGNMALTVALRLHDLMRERREQAPATAALPSQTNPQIIKLIIAWYADMDFTITREDRKKTNPKPSKELPLFLVRFFDASYLHPINRIPLDHAYLSPGLAPDEMLLSALPKDVLIYTCEYDSLCAEGVRFRDRLGKLPGKNARGRTILGARHAWDRMPVLFGQEKSVKETYAEACGEIRRVFHESSDTEVSPHA